MHGRVVDADDQAMSFIGAKVQLERVLRKRTQITKRQEGERNKIGKREEDEKNEINGVWLSRTKLPFKNQIGRF